MARSAASCARSGTDPTLSVSPGSCAGRSSVSTDSAICTLGLRTELRDRKASPRTRHRTPNGASGADRDVQDRRTERPSGARGGTEVDRCLATLGEMIRGAASSCHDSASCCGLPVGRVSDNPAGTCKMGVVSRAVVNSELRVRGVKALGVVDASIMPAVPRGKHSAPDRHRRGGRGPGADLGLDPASTRNRPRSSSREKSATSPCTLTVTRRRIGRSVGRTAPEETLGDIVTWRADSSGTGWTNQRGPVSWR